MVKLSTVLTLLLFTIPATSCGPTHAEQEQQWWLQKMKQENEQRSALERRLRAASQELEQLQAEDRRADDLAHKQYEDYEQQRAAYEYALSDAQAKKLHTARENQNQESWQRFYSTLTKDQRDALDEADQSLAVWRATMKQNYERKGRILELLATLQSGYELLGGGDADPQATNALMGIQDELRKLREQQQEQQWR